MSNEEKETPIACTLSRDEATLIKAWRAVGEFGGPATMVCAWLHPEVVGEEVSLHISVLPRLSDGMEDFPETIASAASGICSAITKAYGKHLTVAQAKAPESDEPKPTVAEPAPIEAESAFEPITGSNIKLDKFESGFLPVPEGPSKVWTLNSSEAEVVQAMRDVVTRAVGMVVCASATPYLQDDKVRIAVRGDFKLNAAYQDSHGLVKDMRDAIVDAVVRMFAPNDSSNEPSQPDPS